MVARIAVSASAPMQRETIRLAVETIGTVGTGRGMTLLRRGLLRRLATGYEGRQSVHIRLVGWRGHRLRLEMRWLRLGLRLRLMMIARIERLRFARRKRLAAHVRLLVLSIVERVIHHVSAHFALLLKVRLILTELLLRGSNQAEIVFGMLVVIFRSDWIARALRVSRQLQVFLGHV
jgi:hypothetical protein